MPSRRRCLTVAIVAGALVAAAPQAVAQTGGETLTIADPAVVSIAAQGGILAWTRVGPDGRWILMARSSGIAAALGIPASRPGALSDLAAGRDARGRVFLTYVRCAGSTARPSCSPRIFSFVTGERRARVLPTLRPCSAMNAWRAWRTTTAVSGYGAGCPRGALIVRDGARSRRLAIPRMTRTDPGLPWRAERITLADLRGDRFSAVIGVGTAAWVWIGRISNPRDEVVYTRAGSEGDCAVDASGAQLAGAWAYWTVSSTCAAAGEAAWLVRAPTRRDAACEGHRQSVALEAAARGLAVDGAAIYYAAPDGIRRITTPAFGAIDCFTTAHLG